MSTASEMPNAQYESDFGLLNQRMRWEVADELRKANLARTNAIHEAVRPADSFYVRHGKRWLDIIVAAFTLVSATPLIVGIAVATAVTMGRPLLFRQERLGKDGKLFTLIKPRTMREAFDNEGRPLLGAQRVTPLGRIIRRTSLDELLNFWSVLKGDMSVIGPRPLVPEYRERFSRRHAQRLAVRPGLNCPSLARGASLAGYQEQFENDVWYVSNLSLRNDLRLVLATVAAVFHREDSRKRAESRRGSFMGYNSAGQVVGSDFVPEWAIRRVLERHGLAGEYSD